jgi:hypothetical protein
MEKRGINLAPEHNSPGALFILWLCEDCQKNVLGLYLIILPETSTC